MALSRSQNRKYWYNGMTRESLYELPPDSIASTGASYAKRLLWSWDGATGVDPRLPSPPASGGITRTQMDSAVARMKGNK